MKNKNCWRLIKDRGAARVIPMLLGHGHCNGGSLCQGRYPGHPRGCPNFGHKAGCPPAAKPLAEVVDLARPIFAIWTVFDLAARKAELRDLHPTWSDGRCANLRYWQATARRALEGTIAEWVLNSPEPMGDIVVLRTPEAHGVDVTATMRSIGQHLEWPPRTITYQVALVGFPRSERET